MNNIDILRIEYSYFIKLNKNIKHKYNLNNNRNTLMSMPI